MSPRQHNKAARALAREGEAAESLGDLTAAAGLFHRAAAEYRAASRAYYKLADRLLIVTGVAFGVACIIEALT